MWHAIPGCREINVREKQLFMLVKPHEIEP